MQVKFQVVAATMRRADDGPTLSQLVAAEETVRSAALENAALRRHARVLADRLRQAEEAAVPPPCPPPPLLPAAAAAAAA